MWAFICATAPVAYSYELPANDSIEYSISPTLLDEIIVKASPVINKTDRKVIRPDKDILQSSSDGLDLLRKLQLSGITINPLTHDISATDGGEVITLINGVEATAGQIAAIKPQDILRVEYHDNPGVRYAGASIVIDYITVRHSGGGNLNLDSFGAFAAGRWATLDHFDARYNNGRSVWNVNIGYMGQHKDKWIRDYTESWHYPDAVLTRNESGLPVSVGGSGMESLVNYNYLHTSGSMFNIRFGLDLNDVPNQEEGDRQAILQTSGSDRQILITEHTAGHSVKPNIAMYYLHKVSERGELLVDAQGSYMKSRVIHEYSEDDSKEQTRVDGRKYAMKFLGMYQNHAGSRSWNVGLSQNNAFIENVYETDVENVIKVNQSRTELFAEYSDRFGNWGFMGNARLVYNHLGQKGKDIDKMFIVPAATVSYRPVDRLFLRYSLSLDHIMPSASEISDITQPIQTGLLRRGNPDLKPFRVINQSLTASYEGQLISAEASLSYRNKHKPIMESVLFEDGLFIRTFFNQRSFQQLTSELALTVRPWQNHLSVTVQPVLTRYFSHGYNYRHIHNIFRVGLGIDFSYGNWCAYGNIMSGSANKMYGEEIIEEKDMNQILAGYKRTTWSLHLGIFNAFIKNYWMETRNLSALTPYISKAHSGRSSSYLALKFNLSLDFGRTCREIEPTTTDSDNDNDSGILTGIK